LAGKSGTKKGQLLEQLSYTHLIVVFWIDSDLAVGQGRCGLAGGVASVTS
jgi:hypothetical protein